VWDLFKIQHISPTKKTATERIAYERADGDRMNIRAIHAAKGDAYKNAGLIFIFLFTRDIIANLFYNEKNVV
jgi:hypothetical protein